RCRGPKSWGAQQARRARLLRVSRGLTRSSAREWGDHMHLLERQHVREQLAGVLSAVESGQGRLVLLGGEAGVGKSALVREFGESVTARARVLIGACDPLSTPTPLGPLLDIPGALGAPVTALLAT